MDGGVIAAIICAVIAVLLAVALFICWRRYPHWFLQREKPFNSFIKVEVKPYSRYQTPQRVSRLDSTGSENEEKRYSFKNNVYNEAGGGGVGGGAEVTICPIYASIQDNLNKEAVKSDEQNNIPKCQRHNSEHKSSKKGMYQKCFSLQSHLTSRPVCTHMLQHYFSIRKQHKLVVFHIRIYVLGATEHLISFLVTFRVNSC